VSPLSRVVRQRVTCTKWRESKRDAHILVDAPRHEAHRHRLQNVEMWWRRRTLYRSRTDNLRNVLKDDPRQPEVFHLRRVGTACCLGGSIPVAVQRRKGRARVLPMVEGGGGGSVVCASGGQEERGHVSDRG
jgi:hypothetical protein